MPQLSPMALSASAAMTPPCRKPARIAVRLAQPHADLHGALDLDARTAAPRDRSPGSCGNAARKPSGGSWRASAHAAISHAARRATLAGMLDEAGTISECCMKICCRHPLLAMLPLAFAVERRRGPSSARHGNAGRRLSGLRRRRSPRPSTSSTPDARGQAAEHQGQHRKHPAAGGRQDRSRPRAGRGGAGGARTASAGRPPICASSRPCTRRPACSWCAPTAPTARSTTSRASRSRSAPRARASSSSRATCSTASASIATRTSRRSSSTAPATGPRW